MRVPVPLVILIVLAFWAAGAMHAQNQQSNCGADRQTWTEHRDQGRRAPA